MLEIMHSQACQSFQESQRNAQIELYDEGQTHGERKGD